MFFSSQLENLGLLTLVMLDVLSGEYLGEDDIVRFDDVYCRKYNFKLGENVE